MTDQRKEHNLPLQRIELGRARGIAEAVVRLLGPYCLPGDGVPAFGGHTLIQVAGSIRRNRPWVHDIDIVLAPEPRYGWGFNEAVRKLGRINKHGPQLVQIITPGNIQIDLYLAGVDTWWTLLLIRTGSARHNIGLCQRAKLKGYTLHADGTGLEELDNKKIIIPRSEEDIFRILGLEYRRPEERECPWRSG